MNVLLEKNNIHSQVKKLMNIFNLSPSKENYEKCGNTIIKNTKEIYFLFAKKFPNEARVLTKKSIDKINETVIQKISNDLKRQKEQHYASQYAKNGNIGDYRLNRDRELYENRQQLYDTERLSQYSASTKKKGMDDNELQKRIAEYEQIGNMYGMPSVIKNNFQRVQPHHSYNPQQIHNQNQSQNQYDPRFQVQQQDPRFHQAQQQSKIPDDVLMKLQGISQPSLPQSQPLQPTQYYKGQDNIDEFGNMYYRQLDEQRPIQQVNEDMQCDIEFFNNLPKEDRELEIAKQSAKVKRMHKSKPSVPKYALDLLPIEKLQKMIDDISDKIISSDILITEEEISSELLLTKPITQISYSMLITSDEPHTIDLSKNYQKIKSIELVEYKIPIGSYEKQLGQLSYLSFEVDGNIKNHTLANSSYSFHKLVRAVQSKFNESNMRISIKETVDGFSSIENISDKKIIFSNSENSVFRMFGFTKDKYEIEQKKGLKSEMPHVFSLTERNGNLNLSILNHKELSPFILPSNQKSISPIKRTIRENKSISSLIFVLSGDVEKGSKYSFEFRLQVIEH